MIKAAAGILAGGRSSRMGKNKASLEWNGSTFLETVLDACQDFHEIYISVDDKEKYAHLPYPLVEDEKKAYGPVEGIYQVLKTMKAEYALILATDMPMIPKELLKDMISALTGEEDCLVLRLEGRPQPLCSIYSKKVLPVIEEMRKMGEHKPGVLFGKVKSRYLDLEKLSYGQEVIDNVNTPSEYEKICRKGNVGKLEDFAPFVKEKLKTGSVMVCYLDGFGYRMYREAVESGSIPFIQNHFCIQPVQSTNPPVTNPAMATILTGVSPNIHGVHSRKDRNLAVPTIFHGRTRENTSFLEGDTRILNTELSPELHTARKGRGCDYWIYKSALRAAEEGKELILAHFHEIDDMAHSWGPYGEETKKKLEETDIYIQELSQAFDGTLLLISDHGLHETPDGGEHGEAALEEDSIAVWGMRNENKCV